MRAKNPDIWSPDWQDFKRDVEDGFLPCYRFDKIERMSMQTSVEIGWIITDPDSDYYAYTTWLFDRLRACYPGILEDGIPLTDNHPEGWSPERLEFETHPHFLNIVFVSYCDLTHGFAEFEEPHELGRIVRDVVKHADGSAKVRWGIIETRR